MADKNLSDVDTFGGGGGNATVPEDAPIQPPQAFVDAAPKIAASSAGSQPLNLSGMGITRYNAQLIDDNAYETYLGFAVLFAALTGEGSGANLSNNSIGVEDINGLLNFLAGYCSSYPNGILNISSQIPPAPPTGGAANSNLLTLQSNGWTVITD